MNKKAILFVIIIIALIAILTAFVFNSKLTGQTISLAKCTDSDNGLNYYLKGTISPKMLTDYCDSRVSNRLVEYSCTPSIYGNPYQFYICPNGCKNGACINQKTLYLSSIIIDNSSFNISAKQVEQVMAFASEKISSLSQFPLTFSIKDISYYPFDDKNISQNNQWYSQREYFKKNYNKSLGYIITFTSKWGASVNGGYSGYSYVGLSYGPGYCNKFKSVLSSAANSSIYLANIDWGNKYYGCGYNTQGVRVSPVSFGGECQNKSGLTCVYSKENGYYACPNFKAALYYNQTYRIGCAVVHELMHEFGSYSTSDHFGTPQCNNITGKTWNLSQAEYYCDMCPYVYDNFRNSLTNCT